MPLSFQPSNNFRFIIVYVIQTNCSLVLIHFEFHFDSIFHLCKLILNFCLTCSCHNLVSDSVKAQFLYLSSQIFLLSLKIDSYMWQLTKL